MKHKGFSSFVLFLDEELYPYFLMEQKQYSQFTDIRTSYKMASQDKQTDYYIVQLDVMDYQKNDKEICKFVIDHISCLALRQENSSFIMVDDEYDFRRALKELYGTKQRGKYFLYDMLTIGERYYCLLHGSVGVDFKDDLQLLHYDVVNGYTYQLSFDSGSTALFKEDSETDIINHSTGEIYNIDVMDGMDILTFKIAILGEKKLEKNH